MKHIVTVAAIAVSAFANFDYAADPALTFDAASNGAEVQERSSRDDVASSNTWSEVRRQLDESETKDGIKRLDGSLYCKSPCPLVDTGGSTVVVSSLRRMLIAPVMLA